MPRCGAVGPSYQSQSPNADAESLVNWYVEQIESGAGNSPLVLYPTAGTSLFVKLTVAGAGLYSLDQTGANQNAGAVTAYSIPAAPLVPTATNEWALATITNGGVITPDVTWTAIGAFSDVYSKFFPSGNVQFTGTFNTGTSYVGTIATFFTTGVAPTLANSNFWQAGFSFTTIPRTITSVLPSKVTMGNMLIVFINELGPTGGVKTITDTLGNVFTLVAQSIIAGGSGRASFIYMCQNIIGGTDQVSITDTLGFGTSGDITVVEYTPLANPNQNGPVRGELQIAGRSFAVCGPGFCEIFANGTFTQWGTIANDGLPVTMAASPQQLLIASAGDAYVFDMVANTVTAISPATFSGQPVSQAGICDDFFLLTIKNSKTFYVSAPLQALDWVTNGSAIISVFNDNVVAMEVNVREIWLTSSAQAVVYYDSGNIFPFDVIPGSFIEQGCAATNTPAKSSRGVLWLGSTERGQGVVYLVSGYTPQRVSNHALEFAIQGYSTIADAVGYCFEDQGHEFYQLYFPTANETWVLDLVTGWWHRRGYYVAATGTYEAHHSQCHMFNFGKHLVGDWKSANVYQMRIPKQTGTAWTFADDNGNLIRRTRRFPHISKEQKTIFIHELRLYFETGLGPQPPLLDGAGNARDPMVSMRWSRDAGHTWSNWYDKPCGQSGKFANRVRYFRLGSARDWVFEIQCNDPIAWRLIDAWINPPGDFS